MLLLLVVYYLNSISSLHVVGVNWVSKPWWRWWENSWLFVVILFIYVCYFFFIIIFFFFVVGFVFLYLQLSKDMLNDFLYTYCIYEQYKKKLQIFCPWQLDILIGMILKNFGQETTQRQLYKPEFYLPWSYDISYWNY